MFRCRREIGLKRENTIQFLKAVAAAGKWGLAHAQEGAGFDVEGDGAFAGLLAIDVAVDHGFALLAGHFAVENFAEGVFVDVADGLFEEVAEPNVAGLEYGHGSQADVAISFVAVELEGTHAVDLRWVGQVFVKALEGGRIADDGIAVVAQGDDFIEGAAQILEILDPKRRILLSDVGLKMNLNAGVAAEMTDEVRQAAVVLFHDRRLDDEADAGADAFFFSEKIFYALEGAAGAVLNRAERFVDFWVNGFERDVDVKRIVGKNALGVGFGKGETVGGESEIDAELLGGFERFKEGLEDGRFAAAQGNIETFSGKFFGLAHDIEHVFAREHGLGVLVNRAERAGQIAFAAEGDVVNLRGGKDVAGGQGKAAGHFLFQIGNASDGLACNARDFDSHRELDGRELNLFHGKYQDDLRRRTDLVKKAN
jgi:hypothetical protein